MTTLKELIEEARANVGEIDPGDVKSRMDRGERVVLLDVRDPDEFRQGHIPGAINISRGFLEFRAETVLKDKAQPVLVYCLSGQRSLLAGRAMQELGFSDVRSMSGGIRGWEQRSFPTVREEPLSNDQMARYSRQIMLNEVGLSGQRKLLKSKVLLIGAGGLGSPLGVYLAAAGVGTLGLVDGDFVDMSNLHRQIIHRTEDVGRPKVESARDTIRGINPDVKVQLYPERLTVENALEIMREYDVVIDGTDNFQTRYLVNDACILANKPQVHGSILQFQGMVTTFVPGKGPCYRCIYPEPPPQELVPSCGTAGVFGVLPGVIGLLQATETLKLLAGFGDALIGRVVSYDALGLRFREMKFSRDPECSACGSKAVRDLSRHESAASCASIAPRS